MTEIDKDKLIDEVSGCNIFELELICKDQKELYTDEEMQLIEEFLEQKRQESKKPFSIIAFAEALFCIVSILVPIGGLIVGFIMLLKKSPQWKKAGKHILLAAFISALIQTVVFIIR